MPITAANIILVVACALVDKDGRVLVGQRAKHTKMENLWEFPGGKIQHGETPEAALIRELKEELAIDVTQACLAPLSFASHAYADFHLLMPLYVCRQWQGQCLPLVHQDLAWHRPHELAKLAMPEADIPLIAVLRDLL